MFIVYLRRLLLYASFIVVVVVICYYFHCGTNTQMDHGWLEVYLRISNDDGVLNYIISFLVLGVLGDAYKEATGK